jgi:acetyl esterase/lipase
LRWVKAHAAQFKGDPQRMALVGYSAGGHLACLAAIQAGKGALQAVVLFAAPTDLVADTHRRGELSPSLRALLDAQELSPSVEKQLAAMSPLNAIRGELPPFLLLHGTDDQSVAFSQSLALREKLRDAEVPCELVTLEGAPHRLSVWPQFDPLYAQKMTLWLSRTLVEATSTNTP